MVLIEIEDLNITYLLVDYYFFNYYSTIYLLSVKLIIFRSNPSRLSVPKIIICIILLHLLLALTLSIDTIPVVIAAVVSSSTLPISQQFHDVLQ